MARPLRIEFPGAVYHVTARGNAREPIFLADADQKMFLSVLETAITRYNWVCHAYCLMDNHYHLLVETPDANLSLGMRQLNGVYTQKLNRRHGRVGHIFQGRFKAIVVEKGTHLLELCRYIVLNPVRSGLVDHPRHWEWSSYRATAYAVKRPSLLTRDWILSQFANTKNEARKRYRDFVARGMGKTAQSPWNEVVGQIIYGGNEFVDEMKDRIKEARNIGEVTRSQRFAGRPSLRELFSDRKVIKKADRNRQIARAHIEYGYTLTAIAHYLGIHYSTASRALKGRRI